MMTKKDFIALANAIRDHDRRHSEKFSDAQIWALASFCRSRNPRFARERWLSYIRGECGPNGGRIRKPKGKGNGTPQEG